MITTEIDINILLLIAVALIFARLLGFLVDKLKQPAVIGEIIAGVILGGIVIWLSDKTLNFYIFKFEPAFDLNSEVFVFLAELGILFLLFISGLETSIKKLKKMGKPSVSVAIGGVLFPFIFGFLVGILFNFSYDYSIVIGLILTATSVGVTVRAFMDIGVLDTDVGATVLGAAVIDDVIGILLLGIVMGIESPLWIVLKIAIFFLIFLYLGLKLIDKILDLGEKIQLPKAFLSISLSILLIYSFFAYEAGIAGIIGAFVAGLLIGQNFRSRKIADDVKTIAYGFFIPLFFVWIGASLWTHASLGSIEILTLLLFVISIIIVSIIGKVLGCSIGAKIAGMSNIDSVRVGVGMVPRMELALIIATAAISKGLIEDSSFAQLILITTVVLTIATTLVAPLLVKVTFKNS